MNCKGGRCTAPSYRTKLTTKGCSFPLSSLLKHATHLSLGKRTGGGHRGAGALPSGSRGKAIGERALLYHIELVQENAQDSQRTDETHQEKEDTEEAAPQRAPVGKLILDNRLGNKPSQEDAGQEATDR